MTLEELAPSGGNGPLCPYVGAGHPGEPHAERHRAAVTIENDVYEAFDGLRDADGELSAEDEARYTQEILERLERELGFTGSSYWDFARMRLYSATATPMSRVAQRGYVEAWWFQCQGCGFVLPASWRGLA